MKLAPIQPPAPPAPVLCTCSICGAKVPEEQFVTFALVCTQVGRQMLLPFHCAAGQHGGCSPDHALEATIACLQEHMHPEVLRRHAAYDAEQDTPPAPSA